MAFPALRRSASGVTQNLRGPVGLIDGGDPARIRAGLDLGTDGRRPLLVGAKVGVMVHDVDERTLDEIGERERTAELSVALDPFVHGTSDLDAQRCEFLRGFELEQSHGGFSCGVQQR